MLEPYADPFKAVYHGKAPVKTSDIVYIEQASGILDVRRAQWYPDVHDHLPSRTNFDTYAEDQFSNPPPPPPKPTRSALRTTSLNSKGIRPQLPLQNCSTSNQHVTSRQRIIQQSSSSTCFSQPTVTTHPSLARKQRREATADQAVADLLKTSDGRSPVFGSSRQVERMRVKSSAGRSYTPVSPAFSQPTATVYPSLARKQRREATADQAVADLLKPSDGRPPVFGSSRQVERMRAKSSAGRSYTPVSPAPPVPTTHYSSRPLIPRSAHNSRTNLNRSGDWR
jgi:hypothetical protein